MKKLLLFAMLLLPFQAHATMTTEQILEMGENITTAQKKLDALNKQYWVIAALTNNQYGGSDISALSQSAKEEMMAAEIAKYEVILWSFGEEVALWHQMLGGGQ